MIIIRIFVEVSASTVPARLSYGCQGGNHPSAAGCQNESYVWIVDHHKIDFTKNKWLSVTNNAK